MKQIKHAPPQPPPPPLPNQNPSARPAARIKQLRRITTTRLRGLTKKQNAACWAARHAVIADAGGPVREPPTDVKQQFEQFVYRGDV
jgi:hypothetical protein